jgi:hypothetical protein
VVRTHRGRQRYAAGGAAGFEPIPPIADPDTPDPSLLLPFAGVPSQQEPFFDACGVPLSEPSSDFAAWVTYAMRSPNFHPAEVLEALTWFPLEPSEAAAYDAPFPRREYMAGVRTFPSLINQLPGANDEAWAGLQAFPRPFVTMWASNDPGNLGRFATQQNLIDNVVGAADQPHTRLMEASHFLQEDQGATLAALLDEWLRGSSGAADFPPSSCEPSGQGITCLSPTACSEPSPVCCGTIPASGSPSSECTTSDACVTSLGAGDRTVRFCATSDDCAPEPTYPLCCAFDQNGVTVRFCANESIAAIAGRSCD